MSLGSPSLLQYNLVNRAQDRLVASFEKSEPIYRQNREYFEQNAASIKSVDDLLKDRRALSVVLSAFQLEDQIDSRALIKKIMTEPVEDKSSLVNRLAEPRYRRLAEAMRPLAAGQEPFQTAEFRETILLGYRTNEFEKTQGDQAPGMREALYFKRMIAGSDSVSKIMADRVLKDVVRTALGLPESFGQLDFDQQKARFEKSVKVEDFQDPVKLEKFIQRFLILNEQQLGIGGTDPVLSLFDGSASGGPGGGGIGLNLLV